MELADLDNLRVSSLVEEPGAALAAPEYRYRRFQPAALWGALERFVSEWQPKLVVLDTLADLFGGDGINRAQS
jgi:RecA-family ATPase